MLNKIVKTLLYLIIFFLPLFVLPVTAMPVAWNKHILLLVLGLVALILWFINLIKAGELKLNWTKLSTVVLILLLVVGISTLFSMARAQSFWSATSAESCLNFILYGVVFFLASNVFIQNKDVSKALAILLISSALVNLLFLIQLLFGPILPWEFSQTIGFNLLGSVWTLAVFVGGMSVVLLSLLGSSQIFKTRFYQILGYLALILFLVSLIIINSKAAWIGVALSLIMVIWQKLKEFPSETLSTAVASAPGVDQVKKIDLKRVYLPAVIFVIAAILIFVDIPLAKRFQLQNLITLNNKSTQSIVNKTFSGSFKNTLIGSGPATFEYQYALHQPQDIVQGPFWQTRFAQGKYALATLLVELGVLGLVGLILIILAFLWPAFKKVIFVKQIHQADEGRFCLQTVMLAVGFYFLVCWFLYLVDFSLLFIIFLILGLWLAVSNLNRKEVVFIKSPQQAFFIMLLGIVVIAGSAVGLFFSGKKYLAAVNYGRALAAVKQKEVNINAAVNLLAKAVSLDTTNDLYLRELSEVYLMQLAQLGSNAQLDATQRQQAAQLIISNLESLTQKMAGVNPKNSQNWGQLGKIYGSLILVNPTALELSTNNYFKASELDPKNPLIWLKLASLNFEMGKITQQQSEQPGVGKGDKEQLQTLYEQNLKQAVEYADKSIALKNNFVTAYYLKALIYDFSKQYGLALANYQVVLQAESGNQEVLKRTQEIVEILNK